MQGDRAATLGSMAAPMVGMMQQIGIKEPDKAQVLTAGSYMFHPAGGVHWDGSNSDETVIVQIIGEGPVTSADVDPALASWVKLPG